MMTRAVFSRSCWLSKRCRPATPTSYSLSTAVAHDSAALTAASSATGRSDVPAAATAIVPLALRECSRSQVISRACGVVDGVRHLCRARRSQASAVARVTSRVWPRSTMFSAMAATCSGVLPSAQDDFGEPLADGAVVVDPGETEV